uniref:Uncharacterized protein n=1 Tax=Salix viminalis TaxID=40686 RepID=A0A6N2MBY0_SALVM
MMISRGGEYLKTFCSFVESGQGKDTCLGDHLILEHLPQKIQAWEARRQAGLTSGVQEVSARKTMRNSRQK